MSWFMILENHTSIFLISALMLDGCGYSHAEIVELPSTSSGGSIRNSQGELSTHSSNYSSGDISGSYIQTTCHGSEPLNSIVKHCTEDNSPCWVRLTEF